MNEEKLNRYRKVINLFPNIDQNRVEWQLEAISAIQDNQGGLVEASVGAGKTYIALFIIKYANLYNPTTLFDIVVPNEPLYNDWTSDEGYIKKFALKNVRVYIINTYVSKETPISDILFIDEVHRTGAETFREALVKPPKIKIGLTGTSEREDNNHLLIYNVMPIVYRLSKDKAERLNYIVPTNVYNYGIEANEELINLDIEAKRFLGLFDNNYDLVIACCFNNNNKFKVKMRDAFGNYFTYYKTSNDWIKYVANNRKVEENLIVGWANKCKNLIATRKNKIYNADEKEEVAKQIIQMFEDKKTIIFCKSKDMVDRLCLSIPNSVGYYSNMPSKAVIFEGKSKQISGKRIAGENLRKFKAGEVKTLVAVNAINEGFNDPEVALILQLAYDSSKINNNQRNGRGVRIDRNDINKICTVINVYFKDTQEEKWLKNKQKHENPIWAFNLQTIYERVKKRAESQ